MTKIAKRPMKIVMMRILKFYFSVARCCVMYGLSKLDKDDSSSSFLIPLMLITDFYVSLHTHPAHIISVLTNQMATKGTICC